jgi:HlyD family secretion protein
MAAGHFDEAAMNKVKLSAAAVAIAMLGGSVWFYRRADGKEPPAYRTAAIERGSLKSTVSATGTLNAVRTVQVGTQVSGQIAQIFVDFNGKVKKGQLLARIDPTLEEQAVEDAQAQLEKAQATLSQAQDDYTRNKQLFDAKVITASEFSTYSSNFSVQQATVKSAQIALDRAKQQLAYTNIYAPIDGVIVQRNVDPGQTVAASLSAPQLFLIANDLSEMQILASVDESDIGQIKEGQSVQFTVQSYPNQGFGGDVQQVRLQSTTQDNVVNYTVVINVKNPGGKLLPGMTATVQFLTGSASNVLTVPNAALRVKPTADMQAQAGLGQRTAGDSTSRARQNGAPRSASGQGGGRGGAQGGAYKGGRPQVATLWYLDSASTVHAVRVKTGLTDGQRTEVDGKGLTAGMQVITSVAAGDAATPAAGGGGGGGGGAAPASNPFQQQGPRGPRGF